MKTFQYTFEFKPGIKEYIMRELYFNKHSCSEWKISTDMRKIFTKIMDYTSLD